MFKPYEKIGTEIYAQNLKNKSALPPPGKLIKVKINGLSGVDGGFFGIDKV